MAQGRHRRNVVVTLLTILLWKFVTADIRNNNGLYSSRTNISSPPNSSRASLRYSRAKEFPAFRAFRTVPQDRTKKKFNDKSLSFFISSRGGSSINTLSQRFSLHTYASTFFFVLLDVFFRRFFNICDISFPSQLGGCCILFLTMLFVDCMIPGLGDSIFHMASPGATFLTKWLPVFFVPGLVMLPFAPSIGSSKELLKVLITIIVGFFFSIYSTAFSVLSLRRLQGSVTSTSPASVVTSPVPHQISLKPNTFSEELLKHLVKGFILSGCATIGATRADHIFTTPLRTVFMVLATLTGFVLGTHLPPKITQIIHPIVTATCFTLLTTLLTSVFTGETFLSTLSTYKTNSSLSPFTSGAGDYLLYIINPTVISFSMAMYGRRKIAAENIGSVLLCMIVASAGNMFGTAFFVRALKFSKDVVRLSLIPRNVTTPLAIAIANILHADVSLTTSVVILSGLFGSTVGIRILNRLSIIDPVTRGLSIGASAQSVGVASISGETEAFPFAAISMILTAVCATTLVSIPFVKEVLVMVASGPELTNVVEKSM